MPTFVDRVILHASAGNGGNGCASIHREKYKPLGGPDGGQGGRGGNVALVVDSNTTTLLAFHHAPHRRATSGKPGQGSNRDGADGEDMILPVPDGTVVKAEDGTVLADLIGEGSTYIVAQGGRGGLGNAALASPRRKAPGFALLGEPGAVRDVVLELKTVADVALVGYPNAGKSSLVAAMSAAKPKIADYPFTTLVPNLGVVQAGESRFTVADVPGLVRGASEGRGLGLEFLRHVERCTVLVHVIDCATMEPDRDPVSDLEAIEDELAAYDETDLGGIPLHERPRIVALNKADVPDARELAEMVQAEIEARGVKVLIVSAATREGLARVAVRHGRVGRAGARGEAGRRGHAHRAAPACGRRRRLHRDADRYAIHRARRPARALDQADRLHQRRSRRLPRRPPEPARCRGQAGRSRRRTWRRGRDRRRVVRLGARHVVGRRAPHRAARN